MKYVVALVLIACVVCLSVSGQSAYDTCLENHSMDTCVSLIK